MGKVDLAIESNPDGSYTYYYDHARPESVLSRAEIDAALQSAAGRKDALTTSSQSSSEPGSRYIDFLIPGLLGMNLMDSGMWGVGFALVEMRQRKLLKRFVATPMRRSDFLLALTSSRLVLMVIEVGLLLGFGVLVFHMRVRGSILSVILLGSLGAVAFGGVGLLTACRAQKIESVSGLINLVMMPMWIFSGVFFSYQKFPAIAQPFIKALPLTALNDALRATIIEGAPSARNRDACSSSQFGAASHSSSRCAGFAGRRGASAEKTRNGTLSTLTARGESPLHPARAPLARRAMPSRCAELL